MNTRLLTPLLTALMAAISSLPLRAHEHLAAGAAATTPGSPLVFVNAADYEASSGHVFGLDGGDAGTPYEGYYYTGDLVFTALAATPDFGGPQPGAAALGADIGVVIETVDGPTGASFGFWETDMDDVDSTSITWSLPVGTTAGTRLIPISEHGGAPGWIYGHKHGRLFSVTLPGLYTIGFRFVDSSTNGPADGPIHARSDRYHLYLQADLTIGGISFAAEGVSLAFATPSNVPDDGSAPPTNYRIEASPALGSSASWQPLGDPIVGDDQLHTLTLPISDAIRFFRLNAE